MKKWKNFLLVVIGFLAIITANAYQDECMPSPSCECPKPAPCCNIPAKPTTSAYNHPANIDICGSWNVFVTGTFLWILPSMEQLEFAEKLYGTGVISVGKVYEFDFEWKAAFKVGLGCNFNHDYWDVYLQYTRINTNMNNTKDRGTNFSEHLYAFDLIQTYIKNCTQLKKKWNLDFNIFDLEFGRPYYNGKFLKFKAHYGLRSGWINHKYKEEAPDGLYIYEGTANSKSWLVGPRAGIKTKWTFCDGFRFFGDAAASIFYQKFYKVSHKEPYASNPNVWYIASDLVAKQLNASLESIVGIGWGTYFDRNNWYFDLAVGYESQLFFNQNKMSVLKELLWLNTHIKAGNFMFNGLNVTAEFDF